MTSLQSLASLLWLRVPAIEDSSIAFDQYPLFRYFLAVLVSDFQSHQVPQYRSLTWSLIHRWPPLAWNLKWYDCHVAINFDSTRSFSSASCLFESVGSFDFMKNCWLSLCIHFWGLWVAKAFQINLPALKSNPAPASITTTATKRFASSELVNFAVDDVGLSCENLFGQVRCRAQMHGSSH